MSYRPEIDGLRAMVDRHDAQGLHPDMVPPVRRETRGDD